MEGIKNPKREEVALPVPLPKTNKKSHTEREAMKHLHRAIKGRLEAVGKDVKHKLKSSRIHK